VDEWTNLERALTEMVSAGNVEVHENGEWLAELSNLRCEFRRQGKQGLIHLWSADRNLVRRVARVNAIDEDRVVLEVQRFGRPKPGKLEFLRKESPRPESRVTREKFRAQFRRLLADNFPEAQIGPLTSSADLEHSFSGLYTRGWITEAGRQWAVLGISASENTTAVDGMLTFGLLWLDWLRQHNDRHAISGLRLCAPEKTSEALVHRSQGINPGTQLEIYEFAIATGRLHKVDRADRGNVESWLIPRRVSESLIAAARASIEKVRSLVPQAAEHIAAIPAPDRNEVALCFQGFEFALWRDGSIFLMNADGSTTELGNEHSLQPQNSKQLEKRVAQLRLARNSLAEDRSHFLYRAYPERWLETMIFREPEKLDAHLDPHHLYSQVPAFSGAQRGILDLIGVTRVGRLVVIELKASEDIHLPLQALDYWLRVRQHQRDDDLSQAGYFENVILSDQAPLLWLVSPGLRFHSSTDAILKYLSPEIQTTRVGLNENWRRGLDVIFRK
jgi:hypothetical protein